MASPSPHRRGPRGGRSWLSTGIAATSIVVLGLAAAGVPGTTSAAPLAPGEPSKVASAFARPQSQPDQVRSLAVRQAIAAERAAQRAEELAKSAEAAEAADQAAAASARQRKLIEANEANRAAAAELVRQSIHATAVKRAAAASQRQDAEAAEATGQPDQGLTATSTIPTGTIPTGTGGVPPVPGAVVGAGFGQYGLWSRYHTGLDFRASAGTPIRAVLAGVVRYAGNSGDWAGNHVAIQHADGTTTMYSHMSSMAVHAGQSVSTGQVIGYVGQTGRAFGPHLHFELYPNGVRYGDVYSAVNPLPWLRSHGVSTH